MAPLTGKLSKGFIGRGGNCVNPWDMRATGGMDSIKVGRLTVGKANCPPGTSALPSTMRIATWLVRMAMLNVLGEWGGRGTWLSDNRHLPCLIPLPRKFFPQGWLGLCTLQSSGHVSPPQDLLEHFSPVTFSHFALFSHLDCISHLPKSAFHFFDSCWLFALLQTLPVSKIQEKRDLICLV